MNRLLKILLLEDNPSDVELLRYELKKAQLNFELEVVDTEEEFRTALDNQIPDLILSDHSMPQFNSTEALKIFHSKNLNIPFILVTGNVSEEFAVQILKLGADDYILKSSLKRLPNALLNALKTKEAEKEKIDTVKKLEESEKHFRSLIENVSDMIFVLDADLKFTYNSPAISKVLGFRQDELISKSFADIVCDQINLFHLFHGEETMVSEVKVKHANNSTRIIECVIKKYQEEDNNTSFIVNARDVTERKKMETKLKTKVNELDTFIYRSSHDMKGPVCTLQGLLNIAMEEVKDPKAVEYLKLINQNNQKLDAILTSLIEITHITRKNSEKINIDLPVFFNDLVTKFNGNMKLVEFKSEIGEIKDFVADPKLLENIFHNLLDNSIRYRKPEHPRSQVNLKIFQQNGHTIFKLRDNGVGIPEDQQEKVFNLFYKANINSTGSGLGLYIARESVEKMDGVMEMESRQGEGTAVTVVIPSN